MIRSFIAIDLPGSVQRALDSLSRELQRIPAPISWVKTDNIHLTLKFLGSIAPEQLAPIQAALERVTAAAPPFQLQPASCGAFPSLKQMRVIWVGLRGDLEALLKLQQDVERALAPLGFLPEDRPFRGHLTLGRVKGRHHLQELQAVLLQRHDFQTESFDVRDLVLYKSDLRPDGARYTALSRSALAARPE
jgi:2'-5' RNA ligase